ncbi:hypothetical protein V6N12_057840 [Hibiscus sabdariffa]|uniref:Uncharacterized protein n=1 Tax=Hibiscus sabdariffa TaxID=183260 RepID=A0ABR1ZN08_9ROSI
MSVYRWNRVADKLAALGRSQSIEGAIYAIPSSTLAVTVADEKRWWKEQRRATISPTLCCCRIDPGG